MQIYGRSINAGHPEEARRKAGMQMQQEQVLAQLKDPRVSEAVRKELVNEARSLDIASKLILEALGL